MNEIDFVCCDFKNPEHTKAYTSLLNGYMSDPMGDYPEHDPIRQQKLIQDLSVHPTVLVVLLRFGQEYAGFTTNFVNYSTFKLKPYLYIHDVFVRPDFRSKNLGKRMMEYLISLAVERNYCKVTLEVRQDNEAARKLYQSLGFEPCKPEMDYWEKPL